MSDDNSHSSDTISNKKGFFSLLLSQLFHGEPKNRDELLALIRDSGQNDLIDEDTRDKVVLPRNTKSGLRHAIEVLADVEEISFNFFHSEDVVRHPVVARIVNAYEAWEEAEQKRKAALAAERKREEQEQK